MPIRTCQRRRHPIYPTGTGQPARFRGPTHRQAARRAALLTDIYPHSWQRRTLTEGWRPPERPR
jgi:hypothetical protein